MEKPHETCFFRILESSIGGFLRCSQNWDDRNCHVARFFGGPRAFQTGVGSSAQIAHAIFVLLRHVRCTDTQLILSSKLRC